MPAYKLVYFDIRGRAELARCVLAAAGVEYEDVRLTGEEWEAYKSKTAFGQLPELVVDGEVLAQSNSIARYLAKKNNLAGGIDWEQAQVDQYVELANDYIEKVFKQLFVEESKKEAEGKKLNEEITPKFMGYFEKSLEKNGSGYFVGSSIRSRTSLTTFSIGLTDSYCFVILADLAKEADESLFSSMSGFLDVRLTPEESSFLSEVFRFLVGKMEDVLPFNSALNDDKDAITKSLVS